jgi:hypothetical protein
MNETKLAYNMDQISESPYVLGCRKQEKYKVIDVALPADWEFPERLFPENSAIFVNNGAAPNIFMLFSETKQFSDIYHLLLEIVRHNKEKEEKLVILNNLQVELQQYFDNLPLADFKCVHFAKSDAAVIQPVPPVKIITEPIKPPSDGAILKP